MQSNSVTYIGFVQDHSGSMKVDDKHILAMNNFNEQRTKLIKDDDDLIDNIVTIVEFDDEIHCNVDNMPVNEVKEMKEWWTGGMTALYDAIAYCINNVKKKMDADERTDKAALIVIQTDGNENYSSEYNGEEGRIKINKMINELEDTKIWTFVFLGENIDVEIAKNMGFKAGNIMNHKSDLGDIKYAYSVQSKGLDSFTMARKVGSTQTMSFYDDEGKKTNDNNKE